MIDDDIFRMSEARHRITVGFLKAFYDRLPFPEAFALAVDGFTRYMADYYQDILQGTPPASPGKIRRLSPFLRRL